MRITFISGNKNKQAEVAQLLTGVIDDLQYASLAIDEIQSPDPYDVIYHKTKTAAAQYTEPFFVEDVSFACDALQGFPGPYIKDMIAAIGPGGLYDICTHNNIFRATAICWIGLHYGGSFSFFEGRVVGEIVPRDGEAGFGFNPVFQPHGYPTTLHYMDSQEKNMISHRALAVGKMVDFLTAMQEK